MYKTFNLKKINFSYNFKNYYLKFFVNFNYQVFKYKQYFIHI